MCGIVGYIGEGNAYNVLIGGLHRLEYRGYDSAGIALVDDNGKLNIYKTLGKVQALENFCKDKNVEARVGIAHTRWATHGEPSDCNAHPHYSEDGNLALVHNGTIENYKVLKDALVEHGRTFHSDTDTEVLVQLIEYIKVQNDCSLLDAVREALKQVVGAYAIAVIEKDNPDCIIAARKSSPLVVGVGDGEFYLASDASPFVEFTDNVVYIKDEEIALIRRGEPLKLLSFDNKENEIDVKKLEMSISQLEKGGYPHFMLKEIFEQPSTLLDCIRGRVVDKGRFVTLNGVNDNSETFINAKRIVIVACGTSWHSALIGKYLIQDMCKIPVVVEYASEFRYSNPVITHEDIVIAISQSGETADTLAAIKIARGMGAFVYGISNVVGSSIPRETHSGTYIHVGPEIGVASTKAFTGQVMVLTLLAMTIAGLKKTLEPRYAEKLGEWILKLPALVEKVLELAPDIERLSLIYTYARNFLYLGRGYSYPVALEGALKLKEISYIHSEAYTGGELKHGPISLIEEGTLVIALCTCGRLFGKMAANIREVKARGAVVLGLCTEEFAGEMKGVADWQFCVPKVPDFMLPSMSILPLQLFAYYVASMKGCDIDKPRNLAKSVTVE